MLFLLANVKHRVEDVLSELLFRPQRILGLAVRRDERGNVRINIESCAGLADVVQDNQVKMLAFQLPMRVLEQVLRFRREADKHLPRPFRRTDRRRNVRVFHQLDDKRLSVVRLLVLLRVRHGEAVIRRSRRLNDNVHVRRSRRNRVKQILRAFHTADVNAVRHGRSCAARNHRHLRAAVPRRLGKRESHLPEESLVM